MAPDRWWPRLRTLLLAHLFGLGVLGLAQFAVTTVHHPGACAAMASPADRLGYWLALERKGPIADLFDELEVNRLVVTLAGIVPLGLLLGWSLWSLRPIRLSLRTLMVIIAVVPVEWTGGVAVWKMWQRWDDDRRLAGYSAAMEKISIETAGELPPPELELDDQQVHEWRAAGARRPAEYGRLKVLYERAMWHPWTSAEPISMRVDAQ